MKKLRLFTSEMSTGFSTEDWTFRSSSSQKVDFLQIFLVLPTIETTFLGRAVYILSECSKSVSSPESPHMTVLADIVLKLALQVLHSNFFR